MSSNDEKTVDILGTATPRMLVSRATRHVDRPRDMITMTSLHDVRYWAEGFDVFCNGSDLTLTGRSPCAFSRFITTSCTRDFFKDAFDFIQHGKCRQLVGMIRARSERQYGVGGVCSSSSGDGDTFALLGKLPQEKEMKSTKYGAPNQYCQPRTRCEAKTCKGAKKEKGEQTLHMFVCST